MAAPRVVCEGWQGVHSDVRILHKGSEPVTHSICADCELAMSAAAAALAREKAGARLLVAAREVVAQFADFEAMTDEAAAAMRELRTTTGLCRDA